MTSPAVKEIAAMLGLVLEDGAARMAEDLAEPPGGGGECRVAVLRAGVCATDLALSRGYMGFSGVPGHEFVGRALDGPLAGRRVVGEINAGCGRCPGCARGDARHCPERTVLGILGRPGAFAEQLSLPVGNLIEVPDALPTDAAVFAEPLAAALAVPEAVEIEPGLPTVVAGDGRLGLLCAHALAGAGARVTVAGRHPERAALLPDGVEIATGWLEPDGPPPDRVASFALAVEATGRLDVLPRLLRLVRPRGTIVLKTTAESPASIDLAPVVVNEQRLVGSRCGRLAPALSLLASGAVPVERFVQARFPLARAPEALARAGEPGVLKVLLDVAD